MANVEEFPYNPEMERHIERNVAERVRTHVLSYFTDVDRSLVHGEEQPIKNTVVTIHQENPGEWQSEEATRTTWIASANGFELARHVEIVGGRLAPVHAYTLSGRIPEGDVAVWTSEESNQFTPVMVSSPDLPGSSRRMRVLPPRVCGEINKVLPVNLRPRP